MLSTIDTEDDKIMTRIRLSHGGGGEASEELIKDIFIRNFNNDILIDMEDAAVLPIGKSTIAFTTDGFTVNPLFFPGGDIGRLAVCGTVNDLLMRGARPLFISASFIIEESFEIEKLEIVAKSMVIACEEAKVKIVTGDTKVVEKGKADGLFIITSGIGIVRPEIDISIKNARPGDKIIVSGTVGDHGMAIIAKREEFGFDPPIKSDCAPLMELVEGILQHKKAVRVLRDPTRGGLAEVLYNIAQGSNVGIEIWEEDLPVARQVLTACQILGLDPLYLANEGKLVAIVESSEAEEIIETIKEKHYGENARIIGQVSDTGLVTLKTRLGTSSIISRPIGELFPRIC